MNYLVQVLFLAAAIEILCSIMPAGKLRSTVAYLGAFIIACDSVLIFGLRPALWAVLLLYFSAFRVFNLFRLIDGRKQIDYLRSSFARSFVLLIFYQLVVVGVTWLLSGVTWSSRIQWLILLSVSVAGVLVMAMSLRRALVKTRPKLGELFRESSGLPSLTVALPARNETQDLQDCLASLVRSDYPKLEILVLDDCSQEKRTPEIIRQFAQSGVRFLEGQVPSDSWTAKNFAYEQLSQAASGELIIFAGVDIRFEAQTIRQMVELMLVKHKSMVSFMPLNNLPADNIKALLLQPLRYLWELGLPRRSFNRPPVLSSCWIIYKDVLRSYGGFASVGRSIVPERYFAAHAANQNDGYSFVCVGKDLGLSCSKNLDEQRDTALRTRYPLVKQRLENVSLLALVEFSLFIAPIAMLIGGLTNLDLPFIVLSLVAMIVGGMLLYKISQQTYGKSLKYSLLVYPVVFAYDIGLSIYSMWLYEFREVVWKGRNVCVPVMQVVPALPEPPPISNSGS